VQDLAALVPPVGVALLFWFVVRAMLRGDRREREVMAALDRQEAERRARAGSGATPGEDPRR
jgi:hypothetical protein